MNVMSMLAVKQLRKNKKRTLFALAGIILSVSMLTAVTGFIASTRDTLTRTYKELRGDWHSRLFPVTESQADEIANDIRIESSYIDVVGEFEELRINFRIKNIDRKFTETTEEIARDYGIEMEEFIYNKELLAVEGVFGSDNSLQTVYLFAIILIAVIVGGSVLVIGNAFYISASERIGQFGILKSAGATKWQISRTVLTEGMVLALIAIPIGLAVGFIVETVALSIANKLLVGVSTVTNETIYFKIIVSARVIIPAALISFTTVFISAWLPAGRVAKTSAIDAIRLAGEITVKPGKIRTAGFIQKIFGFEGSLAAKALKRSKGKYRSTVISLTVSIVLFILGNGFGLMLFKSADMVYPDYGVDVVVMVNCSTSDNALYNRLTDKFTDLADEKMSYGKNLWFQTKIDEAFLTEDAMRYFGQNEIANFMEYAPAHLASVDAETFDEICRTAGLLPDALSGHETPKGILINTAIRDHEGKRVEFQPFNYINGTILTAVLPETDEACDIMLVGATDEIPLFTNAVANSDRIGIILRQDVFDGLTANMQGVTAIWAAKTKNPDAFGEACEEIIGTENTNGSYNVRNVSKMSEINKNLNMLVMIFVYGFVGMLTLIAVTSVVGTISANINLRAREFAMLSSVGMTQGGLRRMLNLESLFYGLKALYIGLPLALMLYYLLYRALKLTIDFAFIWPWQGVLICIAAVMLITFGTMRYSVNRLKEKNIVETLKDLNI